MAVQGIAETAPDPTWTDSELIDQAEDCISLSAAWLAPLASVDTAALTPDERLAFALVMQRMVAVTEALALTALAAVPDRSCRPDPALAVHHPEAASRVCKGGPRCPHAWQIDEIAAMSGIPRWAMRQRYLWARSLTGPWAGSPEGPWAGLLPLLAGGQISLEHLRRFDRITTEANPEATTAAVDAAVTRTGAHRHVSVDALGRAAKAAVKRHTSPEEALTKHRNARTSETGIAFQALSNGLAALTITGDLPQLEAIRALLHEHPAVTRPDPEDTRTKGQRQVDLLVSLCLIGPFGTPLGARTSSATGTSTPVGRSAGTSTPASSAGGSPTGHSSDGQGSDGKGSDGKGSADQPRAGSPEAARPTIGVIITTSLETLLGLSNEPGTVGDTITDAALIRHWATNPDWARRAIIDHHGVITTLSRKQRTPALRLRDAVRYRWGRCSFPGCHQPARASHLDHAQPYGLGGDTTLENLHPLCPRHHLFKEQPGVHVRLNLDNTATWTLPSGRTLHITPDDQRPQPGPHDGLTASAACYEPGPQAAPLDDQPHYTSDEYDALIQRIIDSDPCTDDQWADYLTNTADAADVVGVACAATR